MSTVGHREKKTTRNDCVERCAILGPMCNPQVDELRLMRALRLIRAGRSTGDRNRFYVAWAIGNELAVYPGLALTRSGELELKDLEREHPQIPDVY